MPGSLSNEDEGQDDMDFGDDVPGCSNFNVSVHTAAPVRRGAEDSRVQDTVNTLLIITSERDMVQDRGPGPGPMMGVKDRGPGPGSRTGAHDGGQGPGSRTGAHDGGQGPGSRTGVQDRGP
ncbi:hypothetical protein F2P81_013321 [Scophthalmus maximus]|uniref:Uncharacterized protein n=1 Tax=Scophthalmus maximus TaxID=52904 RepID=A0A6A4SNJ8_SCOMX|nr:hypothetical protein F2P81_013321 [Scophthalmus maximus]